MVLTGCTKICPRHNLTTKLDLTKGQHSSIRYIYFLEYWPFVKSNFICLEAISEPSSSHRTGTSEGQSHPVITSWKTLTSLRNIMTNGKRWLSTRALNASCVLVAGKVIFLGYLQPSFMSMPAWSHKFIQYQSLIFANRYRLQLYCTNMNAKR